MANHRMHYTKMTHLALLEDNLKNPLGFEWRKIHRRFADSGIIGTEIPLNHTYVDISHQQPPPLPPKKQLYTSKTYPFYF